MKLKRAIIEAAGRFQDNNPEKYVPEVLFVQKIARGQWEAEFSDDESIADMTRWDTGADVVKLYNDVIAGDKQAAENYVVDVEAGWDEDWTN